MLSFITGGIKSGKSVFAEKLAEEQAKNNHNDNQAHKETIYYVATAIITDEEMQKRVEIHRNRRPAYWQTIEEKHDLAKISSFLPEQPAIVLIDCLTTLLTNRLWKDHPELFEQDSKAILGTDLQEEFTAIAKDLAQSKHHYIVVSNEVGLSLIPPNRLGRIFCDLQGKVNQIFAEYAQDVYFTVSGIPMKIK